MPVSQRLLFKGSLGGERLTSTNVEAPELAPLPEKTIVPNALKPDVFQDFPLKEKTVLSHNVAMLVFSL